MTVEQFNEEILHAFISGKRLFYRGERINAPSRHLLPTMFREPKKLFENNDLGIIHIDAEYIYNYYKSMGNFVNVFRNTMGNADEAHLYNICAFAQHYCHFSPLIDFTKSLYPALSFAIKDRKKFDEDIVLYILELKNDDDYTTNITIADKWLSELNIYAGFINEEDMGSVVKEIIESRHLPKSDEIRIHLEQLNTPPSPEAKLIDVPTNTRMRFQQGVFLLLNDFRFFNVTYFTKNIRSRFEITKYIISKEVCPYIAELIQNNAPWYSYKYLTDVETAFKVAIET